MKSVRESKRMRTPSVPIAEMVYLPTVVDRVVVTVSAAVEVEPGERVTLIGLTEWLGG